MLNFCANSPACRGLQTRTSRNSARSEAPPDGFAPARPNREWRARKSGAREMVGGDGGNGRGPHLGDQAAVHRHERFAGFRAKKEDHRVMRRDALVVRVKSNEFGPKRAAVGGHHSEEPVVLGHRQDQPHRLLDFARESRAMHPPSPESTLPSAKARGLFPRRETCLIVAAVCDRRKRMIAGRSQRSKSAATDRSIRRISSNQRSRRRRCRRSGPSRLCRSRRRRAAWRPRLRK